MTSASRALWKAEAQAPLQTYDTVDEHARQNGRGTAAVPSDCVLRGNPAEEIPSQPAGATGPWLLS